MTTHAAVNMRSSCTVTNHSKVGCPNCMFLQITLNVSTGPEAGSVDFHAVRTYYNQVKGFHGQWRQTPGGGTCGIISDQGACDVISSPHAWQSGGRLQRHKSRQAQQLHEVSTTRKTSSTMVSLSPQLHCTLSELDLIDWRSRGN